jgi:hypothetical protein
MSDDNEALLASEAPQNRQGDLILYDYFKHLTTLSLLVLGGILTLSQTAKGAAMKPTGMMMVVGVVVLAGITSFSGSGEIARAHYKGDRPKWLDLYRIGAPMILSIGVGMFLFLFNKALR